MEHPQYILDLIKEQSKHDIKPNSSQHTSNHHPYPTAQAAIPLHQPQVFHHVSRTSQVVTAPTQVLTTPPHITSPHKIAIPPHQPQVTRHILRSPPVIPTPTHIISSKEKKRVRFASRLSTTREYTPEPDKVSSLLKFQKEKKHIEITLNFRAKRTLLVTEQFLGINLGYLNLETYKPLNISTVMK